MALKDMDVGVKILGGIVAFALLMAMMSNGDPDNDAWGAGERADDEAGDGDDPSDPWSAGPDDGADAPACDGVAPFTTDEGTILLPVHGPVVPFPSSVCQLGPASRDVEAVGTLQHALAACNGEAVAVDGVYGPDTRRAVAAVQAALGLEADGIYGPRSRVAMAWPTEPEPPDPPDLDDDAPDPPGPDDDEVSAAADERDSEEGDQAHPGQGGEGADDAPSSVCISGG